MDAGTCGAEEVCGKQGVTVNNGEINLPNGFLEDQFLSGLAKEAEMARETQRLLHCAVSAHLEEHGRMPDYEYCPFRDCWTVRSDIAR